MSEINKVYKQYGEIAGKQYLVLLYSSMHVTSRFDKNADKNGLAAFRTRFEDYIKKEYGDDFFKSYSAFSVDAESNQKLLKELDKFRTVYLKKSITDLEKEPPKPVTEVSSVPKKEEPWKAAARKLDIVGQNAASSPSRNGSVSIKGMKADFSYDDPDKAIPIVKSALFLQPHDSDNWCALGDLYAVKRDWKSALAYYEKALTKNARSSRAVAGKEKAQGILNGSIPDDIKRSDSAHSAQNSSDSMDPASGKVVYYFENMQEFMLYVALNKDKEKREIIWGKGPQYKDACKRAGVLFDQKQYAQAIDVFNLALKVNPVGVFARCEICSAYSQMHNLSAAREALKGIEPYVYSDQVVAKYYRLLGYILIDEEDYKTAANVYQYSLFFDSEQQTVKQELLYIVNKAGFEVLDGISDRNKVEKTLKNAGIPLLTPVVPPVLDSDGKKA